MKVVGTSIEYAGEGLKNFNDSSFDELRGRKYSNEVSTETLHGKPKQRNVSLSPEHRKGLLESPEHDTQKGPQDLSEMVKYQILNYSH